MQPRVPAWGKKVSKPLAIKICGDWGSSGRNSQPHRRVCWRDPEGPRMYTNPPTRESAPEGPNLLVGRGGGKWLKASRELSNWHCSLSDSSPTYNATTQQPGLPHPGEYIRLCPLQHNRCIKKRNMTQMKKQIKAPEKTQLSDEEIANLSDA